MAPNNCTYLNIKYILTLVVLLIEVLIGDCGSEKHDLSHIKDELVLKTVQEFLNACPYTDLCTINSNKTFPTTVDGFRAPIPCCKKCECNIECGTSCCPDKLDSYLTADQIRKIEQPLVQCQRAQYKKRYENNTVLNTAFFTVSLCPKDSVDDNVSTNCQRDYQDFNFDEDLSYFAPVSNATTIFKNKYCAICNGADVEELEYWDIGLKCFFPATYPVVHSFNELIEAVDNEERCDLFFNPISSRQRHEVCRVRYGECNVTGLWEQYDFDLERACLSYTSVYKDYFKNVHCFLCNSARGERTPSVCETKTPGYSPNSFVSLLDFRNLKDISKTSSKLSASCQSDHIFDKTRGMCRPLICLDYMTVSEGDCRSLFLSLSETGGTVYDIVITVEARDYLQNQRLLSGYVEMLYSSISYHISNLLTSSNSKFSICQIFAFVVLRRNIDELIKDVVNNTKQYLSLSEIDYFAFRIQLSGNIENITEELDNLSGLFENYNQLPGLTPYIIRFRNIPIDLFTQAWVSFVHTKYHGNAVADTVLNGLELDVDFKTALRAGYHDATHNLTIGPVDRYTLTAGSDCHSVALYQVQPFCPKIELLTDEFRITNDGIFINKIHLFVPNHEVTFTFNLTALICYRNYISAINQVELNNEDSGMEPIMIVTIIVLSLSLISLTISLVIYSLFKQLRTLPGLNLIGLICSLFVTHLLTLINGTVRITLMELCVAFGIVLHFSLLVSFAWMFVCTFHMVRVFASLEKMNSKRQNKFRAFAQYLAFTMMVSTLFVVINIIVSTVRSNSQMIGYDGVACYLDSKDMILFTVAIPVGIVVIANVVMFLCVVIKVGRIPNMKNSRNTERNNITIFAKLSTITGITWTFGFLYQFTLIEAFSYIFVVLNASQGLFIMMAFVVNKRIIDLIKASYLEHFHLPSSHSDTSALHSHQTDFHEGKYSLGIDQSRL